MFCCFFGIFLFREFHHLNLLSKISFLCYTFKQGS